MDDDLILYPPWRQAVENFRDAGFTHGGFVSKEWLYESLGIEMPRADTPHGEAKQLTLRFLKQFELLRAEILEQFQMDLDPGACGQDRGYYVVEPKDQTRLAMQDGRREVGRALRKMTRRVVNVNTSELTDEQRRENADAQAKIARLAQFARRAMRNRIEGGEPGEPA